MLLHRHFNSHPSIKILNRRQLPINRGFSREISTIDGKFIAILERDFDDFWVLAATQWFHRMVGVELPMNSRKHSRSTQHAAAERSTSLMATQRSCLAPDALSAVGASLCGQTTVGCRGLKLQIKSSALSCLSVETYSYHRQQQLSSS